MMTRHTQGGFYSLCFTLTLLAFLFCCWLGGLAYGTEAPGCGNQHYRPRLTQCCPKYLAGEALPPKCSAPLRDGFLQQCCPTPTCDSVCKAYGVDGTLTIIRRDSNDRNSDWCCCEGTTSNPSCAIGSPTPAPSPTCPAEWWYCPHDGTPTPYATPASKGSCCAQVLREYRDRRHAIIDAKQAELKTLIRWKQGQMAQCRELYGSR